MRYVQHNIPAPNKVYDFSILNFVGGLNNRAELIETNQCSSVLNMAFSDDTVMDKRHGSTHFDTLTLEKPIRFLDEYKPYNDDNVLIRATEDEIYFGNMKVAAIQGEVSGTNFSGKYYFVDGEKIRVYGMFAQETSTYEEVKGTPVDTYTMLELVNPDSGYTPLSKEHTQGKVVVDYEKGTLQYQPCAHEMEDVHKNANVLPKHPTYIVAHDGRLYISGSTDDDDNVYISDVQNGYYFPSTTAIQLTPNSDKVVALNVYDDSVVVGRRYDVHVIRGKTNNPELGFPVFELQKMNTHTGMASHKSVSAVHNYLFYLGSDGNVYSIASTTNSARVLSTSIINQTVDLFKTPVGLTRSDLYEACSVFHDDQYYLSIKDVILIYSYRYRAWTMYKGLNARCFYRFDTVLLWGNDKGRIVMPSEDYLDHGVPYEAHWKSGIYDMGTAINYKHFKEFYVVAHTFDKHTSSVRLKFEVDYVDIAQELETEAKISKFGEAKFGDRFISRSINASFPALIGVRGRQLRFTMVNGDNLARTFETLEEMHATTPQHRKRELAYCSEDGKYYLFLKREWVERTDEDLNQPMRIYQVNGEYEMRTKR